MSALTTEVTQSSLRLLQAIVTGRTIEAVMASQLMGADLETVMLEIERKIAATLPRDYFAQIPIHDDKMYISDIVTAIEQHTDAMNAQLQTVIDAVYAGEIGQVPAAQH